MRHFNTITRLLLLYCIKTSPTRITCRNSQHTLKALLRSNCTRHLTMLNLILNMLLTDPTGNLGLLRRLIRGLLTLSMRILRNLRSHPHQNHTTAKILSRLLMLLTTIRTMNNTTNLTLNIRQPLHKQLLLKLFRTIRKIQITHTISIRRTTRHMLTHMTQHQTNRLHLTRTLLNRQLTNMNTGSSLTKHTILRLRRTNNLRMRTITRLLSKIIRNRRRTHIATELLRHNGSILRQTMMMITIHIMPHLQRSRKTLGLHRHLISYRILIIYRSVLLASHTLMSLLRNTTLRRTTRTSTPTRTPSNLRLINHNKISRRRTKNYKTAQRKHQ